MTSIWIVCRRRRTAILLVAACCTFLVMHGLIAWLIWFWESENRIVKPTMDVQEMFTDYSNYNRSVIIPAPIRDPQTFSFLINEPDICDQRHPDLKILYYVHSAPGNFQRRRFIRNTWSSPHMYPKFKMVTLFVVGMPTNDNSEEIQEQIENESRIHKDMLQVDFADHYYNLTFKSVTALNWIRIHCLRAQYVLKTDDDAFVNIFRLTNVLLRNEPPVPGHGIHCYAYHKFRPHRDPASKWYVSTKEYPWTVYPDFCPGMAMYFPSTIIPKLLNYTSAVPFLKLDDVYLTGLLRQKSNVELINVSQDINIYHGKDCIKGSKMELFCQVPDIHLRWEIWIRVITGELSKSLSFHANNTGETISTLYQMLVKNHSNAPG